jgi:hypothetical protein
MEDAAFRPNFGVFSFRRQDRILKVAYVDSNDISFRREALLPHDLTSKLSGRKTTDRGRKYA